LSDPSDAQLIQRLRSGDRAAWDSLFTTYSESVWRYVATLLGNDSAAVADVVQETFQSIMQSIGQFDGSRGSLWGWITGIAHNRAMLHWRSRRRDLDRLAPDRVMAESNGRLSHWFDAADPPSSLLEQEESAHLVRQVLADLPDDYAHCLIAKYIEDRTSAEIADSLGESVDTIRSRLTRARAAFREKIQRAMASVEDS
jgi:RNA polymerase sigma-70 factor (ECF subfamily)